MGSAHLAESQNAASIIWSMGVDRNDFCYSTYISIYIFHGPFSLAFDHDRHLIHFLMTITYSTFSRYPGICDRGYPFFPFSTTYLSQLPETQTERGYEKVGRLNKNNNRNKSVRGKIHETHLLVKARNTRHSVQAQTKLE